MSTSPSNSQIVPLGNQQPLLPAKPLGQGAPQLQFLKPLGTESLGVLNPSIFSHQLTHTHESLVEPFSQSPFFKERSPVETPQNSTLPTLQSRQEKPETSELPQSPRLNDLPAVSPLESSGNESYFSSSSPTAQSTNEQPRLAADIVHRKATPSRRGDFTSSANDSTIQGAELSSLPPPSISPRHEEHQYPTTVSWLGDVGSPINSEIEAAITETNTSQPQFSTTELQTRKLQSTDHQSNNSTNFFQAEGSSLDSGLETGEDNPSPGESNSSLTSEVGEQVTSHTLHRFPEANATPQPTVAETQAPVETTISSEPTPNVLSKSSSQLSSQTVSAKALSSEATTLKTYSSNSDDSLTNQSLPGSQPPPTVDNTVDKNVIETDANSAASPPYSIPEMAQINLKPEDTETTYPTTVNWPDESPANTIQPSIYQASTAQVKTITETSNRPPETSENQEENRSESLFLQPTQPTNQRQTESGLSESTEFPASSQQISSFSPGPKTQNETNLIQASLENSDETESHAQNVEQLDVKHSPAVEPSNLSLSEVSIPTESDTLGDRQSPSVVNTENINQHGLPVQPKALLTEISSVEAPLLEPQITEASSIETQVSEPQTIEKLGIEPQATEPRATESQASESRAVDPKQPRLQTIAADTIPLQPNVGIIGGIQRSPDINGLQTDTEIKVEHSANQSQSQALAPNIASQLQAKSEDSELSSPTLASDVETPRPRAEMPAPPAQGETASQEDSVLLPSNSQPSPEASSVEIGPDKPQTSETQTIELQQARLKVSEPNSESPFIQRAYQVEAMSDEVMPDEITSSANPSVNRTKDFPAKQPSASTPPSELVRSHSNQEAPPLTSTFPVNTLPADTSSTNTSSASTSTSRDKILQLTTDQQAPSLRAQEVSTRKTIAGTHDSSSKTEADSVSASTTEPAPVLPIQPKAESEEVQLSPQKLTQADAENSASAQNDSSESESNEPQLNARSTPAEWSSIADLLAQSQSTQDVSPSSSPPTSPALTSEAPPSIQSHSQSTQNSATIFDTAYSASVSRPSDVSDSYSNLHPFEMAPSMVQAKPEASSMPLLQREVDDSASLEEPITLTDASAGSDTSQTPETEADVENDAAKLEELAQVMYRMMQQRLAIARERSGNQYLDRHHF